MWIVLENNISDSFVFNNKYTYLLPLSKINVIVGKNNSGKSYLMRQIIKSTIKVLSREDIKNYVFNEDNFVNPENIEFFSTIDEFKEINDKYFSILNQIKQFEESKYESSSRRIGGPNSGIVYNFYDFEKLKNDSIELIEYLGLSNESGQEAFSDNIIYNKNKIVFKIIDEYKELIFRIFDEISNDSIYKFGEVLFKFGYVRKIAISYHNEYNLEEKNNTTVVFKNYIPLLRNIRDPLKNPNEKIMEPTKNIFKTRILKEYKYNEDEVDIITGLDFYFDYKKRLLGNKLERQTVNEFENFLSMYFFEGKEISIIPDEETYELKINIDDQDDRFIYQVGDGITSLIIIMYKIFLGSKAKNNIYFIEEPEQSFHPGFQRLFMNIITLNDKFKDCYFFFTTHSNHLIDISNHEFKNFKNYLCNKESNGINIKVQSEVDVSAIEELGVKPSSVQIANKIIWIEGKYDAFYIRLLLNRKNISNNKRKYIEDYDYSFVPYGGSNGALINFSIKNSLEENREFITKAKSINSNMLLIMDDDGISQGKSNSAKSKRYEELKNILKNRLYKLEVREIENIFPEEVIKEYFVKGLKSKKYDLKFVQNIKYEDYKNEKLGKYFNNLVENNIGNDLKKITGRQEGFEKNGFLYDKAKFYDVVLKWVMSKEFDYNKLPIETKKLIEIVEEFIEK